MARLVMFSISVMVFFTTATVFASEQDPLVDPLRPSRFQAPETVPSAPSVTKKAEEVSSWQFTTVLISNERSVAVINGQAFQVGDVLEGYRLVEIFTDKVVFKNSQGKRVLKRAGTGLRKTIR